MHEDETYLYTFRYLLERMSWMARDCSPRPHRLKYTLAHIVRFPLAKLREYESALRCVPGCQIAWDYVDSAGGALDQPKRIENLQLADITASAIGAAFNPDQFGNVERRYLENLAPRFYRGPSGRSSLYSYGMKLHPTDANTKAAYPWVAAS
ncbi:hypothetical protein ACVBEQ_09890 [Nakamurella sp. GG22]